MPGLITHNLVAAEVIGKIGTSCEPAFLLGSLGPDVCYFHRAMPWQRGTTREFGKKMHYSDPSRLFDFMTDLVLKSGDGAVQSYVEGFLCHYALDSSVHPFVYSSIPKYKIDNGVKYNNSFVHNLIEYKTDALILMEKRKKRIKDFDLDNVIPLDGKALKAAAYVLSRTVNCLFADKRITEEKFIEAYGDLSHNTKNMQKSGKFKVNTVSFLESLFHIGPALSPLFWGEPDYTYDYMNTAHREWYNLNEPEIKLSDSYLDLADKAVEYTSDLILELRDALDRGERVQYSLDKLFVNGKRIEEMK